MRIFLNSGLAAVATIALMTASAGAQPFSPALRATGPDVAIHAKNYHYVVPPGYDADVALHPYTSGLGPCTEGAVPSTGCRHPKVLIQPSNYDQPPFDH